MLYITRFVILFGGIFHLIFAVFHLFFWKIFHWQKDLSALSFVNRRIMHLLNFSLIFYFLTIAHISFFHGIELMETSLGVTFLLAVSLFWFLRMLAQIILFGITNKKSLFLTVLFVAGSILYLFPVIAGP